MDPEEFLSEQKQKPTYSAIEILRMLHDESLDKHLLFQIIGIVSSEGARYDPKDLKILTNNITEITKKVNEKVMADARKGIYEPLQKLDDIISKEE